MPIINGRTKIPATHLRNGVILRCDPEQDDLLGGDVLIRNGKIEGVGKHLETPPGTRVVELDGAIVMPGLIDAHQHVWEAPYSLEHPNLSLGRYFAEFVADRANAVTPDSLFDTTKAALTAAVRAGTTFTFDWCHATNTLEHAEASLAAAAESGSRYTFGYGPPVARGFYGRDVGHPPELEVFAERHRSIFGGRLMAAAALRGPDLSPEQRWRNDIIRARAAGLPVSLHVGTRRSGSGGIRALYEADLLGPDVQLIHTTDSTTEELLLAAATGAKIVVPPIAQLAMGTGTPPLRRLAAGGIDYGLGVDTVLGSPGDMFSQLRAAAVLLRDAPWQGEDPPPGSRAAEVLHAATLGAARSVWRDDVIGSLTDGKQADLLVLRPERPVKSLEQAYAEVVWSGDSSRLQVVLIDGEDMLSAL